MNNRFLVLIVYVLKVACSYVIFIFSKARGRRYRALIFRQLLEKLGVLFIKIGQILSTRIDLFSYEYQQELAKLLDNSKPIPFPVIKECVEKELKADINSVFDSIDERPLASASIGQVHKAVHKGEAVAIKVQRPGIRKEIDSDFDFLNRIFRLVSIWPRQLWVGISKKDIADIINDVARMSVIELDYIKEANELIYFAEHNFRPGNAQFPKVHLEVTTPKLLVTEFLEGIPFVDLMERIQMDNDWLEKNGYNKVKLAEVLLETQLKQLFVLGNFQADSHPGNLILTGVDTIGFVDFGIVGKLPEEFRKDMLEGILAEIFGDYNLAFELTIKYALPTERTNVVRFKREVFDLMKSFREANYKSGVFKDKSLGVYLETLTNLYRKHNLNLTPGFTAYMRSSIVYGNTFAFLFPDLNYIEMAKPIYLSILIDHVKGDFTKITKNDILYGIMHFKLLFDKIAKKIRNSDTGLEIGGTHDHIRSMRKSLVNINAVMIGVLLLISSRVFEDFALFDVRYHTIAGVLFILLAIVLTIGFLRNAFKG